MPLRKYFLLLSMIMKQEERVMIGILLVYLLRVSIKTGGTQLLHQKKGS
jgi:hypothetical protein